MSRLTRSVGVVMAGALALIGQSDLASAQSILEKVRQRGYVSCGASQGVPGLSRPDEKGVWRGFDSDVCRAVAVAVFGDKDKARFVPLNAAQRLPAIQTGEIDVLSRTTTMTFTRDMAVRFVALTIYDNDALLVHKKLNIKTAKDLNGLTVCLQGGGSLTEQALDEMEEENPGVKMKRVYFDSTIQARDSYFAGRCDSYVTDGLAAWGQRASAAKNPEDHQVFYVGHSTEPNGVAIPRGDDKWFDITRYAINVLIWAEDEGITSANVDEVLKTTKKSEVKRVLGGEPGWGKIIGLDDKWAYNIIKQLGNYGEIWDRNLGKNSRLQAERKLNKLYKNGGLMFPIPFI
ncbi:MAG: amino acid ABC transporter substrate-binding protein [Hyphomicrobiaceae bacterium]|nr:MAG: amino acid ABC transporter substrate-binding protein [Hyphomicrobiaceae bacterium]